MGNSLKMGSASFPVKNGDFPIFNQKDNLKLTLNQNNLKKKIPRRRLKRPFKYFLSSVSLEKINSQ